MIRHDAYSASAVPACSSGHPCDPPLCAGEEPYRKLGIKVNEEPINPPVACQLVRDTGNNFTRYYQEVSPR